MIERPALLHQLYRNAEPDCTLEQFAVHMGEWELTGLEFAGQHIGVLAEKDGEIHIAIEPEHRRHVHYWRTGMSELVQPLVDRYGFVSTVVMNHGQDDSHRFVQRLGFKQSGTDEQFTYYTMTHIRHQKKDSQPCQQP